MELVMNQLELKFFWPLTEQVPLDLDYTDCEKPRMTMPIGGIDAGGYALYHTGSTTITASNLSIDVDTTTIKVNEEPPLYRKALYKMLNLKWEKK